MGLFNRRADPVAAPTSGAGPALMAPSRQLAQLIAQLQRRGETTTPRVLACGPVSSTTIETFHAARCRVTVGGDELPQLPLEYPDHAFDLVLGYETLDRLDDGPAHELALEWQRILVAGGQLYLLTRREPTQAPPTLRVDISQDGTFRLQTVGRVDAPIKVRQNADFTRLLAPMSIDEIALRRDGLRELLCRRR
jgi:hypothetical protein